MAAFSKMLQGDAKGLAGMRRDAGLRDVGWDARDADIHACRHGRFTPLDVLGNTMWRARGNMAVLVLRARTHGTRGGTCGTRGGSGTWGRTCVIGGGGGERDVGDAGLTCQWYHSATVAPLTDEAQFKIIQDIFASPLKLTSYDSHNS